MEGLHCCASGCNANVRKMKKLRRTCPGGHAAGSLCFRVLVCHEKIRITKNRIKERLGSMLRGVCACLDVDCDADVRTTKKLEKSFLGSLHGNICTNVFAQHPLWRRTAEGIRHGRQILLSEASC